MAFNFQKFTETESSFCARVTVRQTGQIGFNNGAINLYHVDRFAYAVLYFDEANRVVGIELTDEANKEGRIEIKKTDTNTYLRAKNFCDRFSIDYAELHRYDLRKDCESGFLYFELSKELAKDASVQEPAIAEELAAEETAIAD